MSRKISQKRLDANRRNAQTSTGPRTPEGKAKASANATTHGLSSPRGNPLAPGTLLHTEDPAAFQALLDEYVVTYQPQHRDEYDLLTGGRLCQVAPAASLDRRNPPTRNSHRRKRGRLTKVPPHR